MKKKLFLIPLALGLAIGVASCGEENAPTPVDDNKVVEDNTPKTDEKTPSYTIKVYDTDNNLLLNINGSEQRNTPSILSNYTLGK